jgi:hypothetical protein
MLLTLRQRARVGADVAREATINRQSRGPAVEELLCRDPSLDVDAAIIQATLDEGLEEVRKPNVLARPERNDCPCPGHNWHSTAARLPGP